MVEQGKVDVSKLSRDELEKLTLSLLEQQTNGDIKNVNTQSQKLHFIKQIAAHQPNSSPTNLVLNKIDELSYINPENIKNVGKRKHVLIEGENLDGLNILLKEHINTFDIIYIDPPYNTGGKKFVYNDTHQNKDNLNIHLHWLEFMEKRLILAQQLLSDTGTILVSIDDNEQAYLKVLMNEIFGEQNFVTNFVWQGGIKNDARFIGGGVDYTLVYAKNKNLLTKNNVKWRIPKEDTQKILDAGNEFWEQTNHNTEEATKLLKQWWVGKKKLFAPGLMEYKYIDNNGEVYSKSRTVSWPGGGGPRYELIHPITNKPTPIPSRGWGAIETTMHEWIKNGTIMFGADETTLPTYKRLLKNVMFTVMQPTFVKDRRSSSKLVAQILGPRKFQFPKDHTVLKQWFQYVSNNNPNIKVLDFFAGSGSTAHAVIEMNTEDDGDRQCYLITNNENNIATDITAKRLHCVLSGQNWFDKKEHPTHTGELEYFRIQNR